MRYLRFRHVAQLCTVHTFLYMYKCYVQTLDAVFPKDLFLDYLEITTAVLVPCGGPKMYPGTSI